MLNDINQFNRLEIYFYLTERDSNCIWNLFRDVSRAEEVSVNVIKGSSPVHADNSFLYNSYIYFGNATSLTVKIGQRLEFKCAYKF